MPDKPEGVFWHLCETKGCTHMVEFDDEPMCFTHSPDSGSSVKGYSAKVKAQQEKVIHRRNVFDVMDNLEGFNS